jgi:RNA polymerase sigma-70 factor, ECF subfamily
MSFRDFRETSATLRDMSNTPALLTENLRLVAAGDRAAFGRVYEATAAKLYGVVLRILKRRDLTDEIVQEVYVKIWQRAGDFDATRASPITWMVTIARNRALDEARKASHIRLDDAPEALEVPDQSPSAVDLLSRAEDRERLLRCLDGLDPQKREIVKLAYLEGFSRDELSMRFGHPVATIKTWLHRSLKQLKECLS